MGTVPDETETPTPNDESMEKILTKTSSVIRLLAIALPLVYYFIMTFPLRHISASWISVTKYFSFIEFYYFLLALFVLYFLLPISFVWAIIAFIRRKIYWKTIGKCFFILIFSFLTLMVGSREVQQFRHNTFEALTERSKPLINAIEKFNSDSGRYPESLVELVPAYQSEVPGTGIPLCPDYIYSRANKETHYKKYEILIQCSGGNRKRDSFFYWPEGNYPEHIYGGRMDKINDWVYVHE